MPSPYYLGSISAVSRVRSLILPEERLFRGMSAGSFSRTAAANRAYLFSRYVKRKKKRLIAGSEPRPLTTQRAGLTHINEITLCRQGIQGRFEKWKQAFSRDVTMPRKVREFGWYASAGSVLFVFLGYLWNTVLTLNKRSRADFTFGNMYI